MQIHFHGHACIQLETTSEKILIDPFFTGNPVAKMKAVDVQTDYILLTHGHTDHIADAVLIAKQNEAPIFAVVELAAYMEQQGVHTIGMNIGGGASFSYGTLKWVPAFHSSSITENGQVIYLGNPAGVVLQMQQLTIYHAGDTALFSDMRLVGERYKPDIAFLPIGSFFTMDPEDALLAAQWVQAKVVIPIHYNTFPAIEQDGQAFVAQLRKQHICGVELQPGQSIDTQQLFP